MTRTRRVDDGFTDSLAALERYGYASSEPVTGTRVDIVNADE